MTYGEPICDTARKTEFQVCYSSNLVRQQFCHRCLQLASSWWRHLHASDIILEKLSVTVSPKTVCFLGSFSIALGPDCWSGRLNGEDNQAVLNYRPLLHTLRHVETYDIDYELWATTQAKILFTFRDKNQQRFTNPIAFKVIFCK